MSVMFNFVLCEEILTETDWCPGALSWRRNQLLVLQFLGCFLLITSLRQQRMSVYISLVTLAIHINDTSEFRELSEATMDKCTMG